MSKKKLIQKGKTLTQSDLARAANVSQGVVSAVLRGDNTRVRYSEEVAERVRRIAREHNYRTAVGARNLRKGTTQTLGLLLSHSSGIPYVPAEIYTGIIETASDLGYYVNLLLDPARWDRGGSYKLPLSFSELAVDGYLQLHTGQHSPELQKALTSSGLPCVYLNDKRAYNAIYVDDRKGGLLAAPHALDCGYKRPAFVSVVDVDHKRRHYSTTHRLEGYTAAMTAAGKPTMHYEFKRLGTMGTMTDFLRGTVFKGAQTKQPDCLICDSDETAIHIINDSRRLGIDVCDRIGIIGFNDELLCELSPVPLTSVRIDWLAMGIEATRMLCYLLEDTTRVRKASIVLEPSLTIRESTSRSS